MPVVTAPLLQQRLTHHAGAAQRARGDRASGLGHPDRAHRHPARVRRKPAPVARRRHEFAPALGVRRSGRHEPDPVEHRHRLDRRLVPRPLARHLVGGAGRDARRRCGHQPDGRGLLVRPVVALAAVDLRRRGDVHLARKNQRRAARAGGDRAGADAAVAAVDRREHPAAHRFTRRAGAACRVAQRRAARHPGRGDADRAVVFQPGDRAADRGAGGFGHRARGGRARPGAGGQCGQWRARGSPHSEGQPGRAPPADRQPGLQTGRLPAGDPVAASGAALAATCGCRNCSSRSCCFTSGSTSRWPCRSSASPARRHGCCNAGWPNRRPPPRSATSTSTHRRWTRRRSRSAAPRAKPCTRPMWWKRCCAASSRCCATTTSRSPNACAGWTTRSTSSTPTSSCT